MNNRFVRNGLWAVVCILLYLVLFQWGDEPLYERSILIPIGITSIPFGLYLYFRIVGDTPKQEQEPRLKEGGE